MRVALFLREHADAWQALRYADGAARDAAEQRLDDVARRVLTVLRSRGASFLRDLAASCALDETSLATRDRGAGVARAGHLRRLRRPARDRPRHAAAADRRSIAAATWPAAGPPHRPRRLVSREAAVEAQARALLERYGVVFRRLLDARDERRRLARADARSTAGSKRAARSAAAASSPACPASSSRCRTRSSGLREIRRSGRDGRLITISAADPLNLTGILTSGDRIRAVTATRIVYRDGVALAALEGDYLRPLTDIDPAASGEVASALAGRRVPGVTSGFVGRF